MWVRFSEIELIDSSGKRVSHPPIEPVVLQAVLSQDLRAVLHEELAKQGYRFHTTLSSVEEVAAPGVEWNPTSREKAMREAILKAHGETARASQFAAMNALNGLLATPSYALERIHRALFPDGDA